MSLYFQDGYWVGYVPTQTPNLVFYPCPPQYCQCSLNSSVGPERCVFMFTQNAPNLQCDSHREGDRIISKCQLWMINLFLLYCRSALWDMQKQYWSYCTAEQLYELFKWLSLFHHSSWWEMQKLKIWFMEFFL